MTLKLDDFYHPYRGTPLPAFATMQGTAPSTGEPGEIVRRSLWRMLASLATREPLRRKRPGASKKSETIENVLRREIPRNVRLPEDEKNRIVAELGAWLRQSKREFPFGTVKVDRKGIPQFQTQPAAAPRTEGDRSEARSVWDREKGVPAAEAPPQALKRAANRVTSKKRKKKTRR